MPALEILQHVRQLLRRLICIKTENPLDDMIGARLVGGIEVARFGRRLERAHDDARGVGAQIERLPIHKCGLQQCASVGRSER